MFQYLTPQQFLFIHNRLIEETGGSHGLRDLGLLEAAVACPQATFDGQDLYPDIYAKAAALMHSLLFNHPFVDGNKRAGIASAAIFLVLNEITFQAANDEVEQFTLSVVVDRLGLEEMAVWFRQHAISDE